MGTDVVVRSGGFDLTRAPSEQWNDEMVDLVARTVFRGQDVTRAQLYFCLSVAEAIDLNPMIQEIYFIPSRSRDAKGPAILPYIGRNGLVKKATMRGYYYESDTVHANDRFRITRKRDGTRELTHSYGSADRGEIVGAYAFLHDRGGVEKPAFFYAKLEEYLPTFDQDWKMKASPWGNQRSAMIEKCAMIGAGRKRLDLGNVLADGEIATVTEQRALSGPVPDATPAEFDWRELERTAGAEACSRLRRAIEHLREYEPDAWPAAKLEMALPGASAAFVEGFAEVIEEEARALESRSPDETDEPVEEPASGPERAAASGSAHDTQGIAGDGPDVITDAEVVPDEERIAALRAREAMLEERLAKAPAGSDEFGDLSAELDLVQNELAAIEDPGQGRLL